jgi:hypothetical protein
VLLFLLPNAVIWQQNYTKRKSLIFGAGANCCATGRLCTAYEVMPVAREASMDQIVLERSKGWALGLADQAIVAAKSRANRLSFAVLLLFFRTYGRFPRAPEEIEPSAVAEVARQLGIQPVSVEALLVSDRTLERHRAEIRALHGFREATVAMARR